MRTRNGVAGVVLVGGLVTGIVALGQRSEGPKPRQTLYAAPVAAAVSQPPPVAVAVGQPPTLPAAPNPDLPRIPAEPEDPVQAVEQFVDQSRSQAERSIKSLTAEADALRRRLQHVENAIARWKQVAQALKTPVESEPLSNSEPFAPPDSSPPVAIPEPVPSSPRRAITKELEPSVLEPAPEEPKATPSGKIPPSSSELPPLRGEASETVAPSEPAEPAASLPPEAR